MGIIYYKIPLDLRKAMGRSDPPEGKLPDDELPDSELPLCDLETSIHKNLELIILTKFGEHRSNPAFGCEVWDLDFEVIVSARSWEEKLRQSLLKSITTHEARLSSIELSVAITDMEKHNGIKNSVEIRKRVDIQINGVIKKTAEPLSPPFHTNLFLSPLSAD